MIHKLEIVKPMEIETRSMEIIQEHLGERKFEEPNGSVIRRCIHTSADFDYADNLVFSKLAVEIGAKALQNGSDIVTDTTMAMSGINKRKLSSYGGQVHCYIGDDDVRDEAKQRGVTRSTISMEKSAREVVHPVYAIGNAPTALIRLAELIEEGKVEPALVIGVPVGFVNVVESKEIMMKTKVPYIIAKGNKGGSNIAAAICNAILYLDGR